MVQLARAMSTLPDEEVLGLCAAFLLQQSMKNPDQVRRVLSEPVIKNGLVGESLITLLNRVSR
jgi:hypothetical protein